MGTYFGDLSFAVAAEGDGHVIRARIEPPPGPWRILDIALGGPGSARPRSVTVNGKPHSDFDSRGNVRIGRGEQHYKIEARF